MQASLLSMTAPQMETVQVTPPALQVVATHTGIIRQAVGHTNDLCPFNIHLLTNMPCRVWDANPLGHQHDMLMWSKPH